MGNFYTPLSGMTAAQGQLESVSNNLANIDTDGYKDQTLTFADIFSQTNGVTNGSGDPLQTGSGVETNSTDADFNEGSLNATNISSNMAISGNGFFIVQDSQGAQVYTRAGDFTTNNQGQITTPDGSLVLGYPAVNGVVNTATNLQALNVGTGVTIPAVPSSTIDISANLDSQATTGTTSSSTLPVYDTSGGSHTVTVTYTKTGQNTWGYSVTIPSADLTPPGSSTNTQVASGTLNFNSSGVLVSTEPTGGTATLPPSAGISLTLPPVAAAGGTQQTFADGAASMNITWNLVTQGTPTLTQTASASATSAASTNGFASGTLQSYTIEADGTISGTFSSGQTLALGQVATASFSNNQGLLDAGQNNYEATPGSGPAVVGVAGTGGRGTIVGGSVEQSNVNIATEFGKMIVAQQAYSANAKTVTTSNQISQATLAILQ
jgi:flagellar hook protein FlgE